MIFAPYSSIIRSSCDAGGSTRFSGSIRRMPQRGRKSFRIYLQPHTLPDVKGHAYLGLNADELEKFCESLSATSVSGNMTGAEIEAAIGEALYRAYDADRQDGGAVSSRLH